MNVFDLEGSISLDISGYKKSLSDAKKQTEDAAKIIKDQAKQIENLKTEFENLKNELDENRKSTDDYGNSADKAADKAENLRDETYDLGETAHGVSDKVGGLATAIGSMMVEAAEIGIAAIGAVSAAIAALSKSSLDAYSSYEQLAGGVETLFGDASETILNNAKEAFMTAGVSANEYLNMATSFAASLIQSTGRGAQQDLELLEETLDDEYDLTKENLNDRYQATKDYWDEQIKLSTDSAKAEKEALKTQKDEELDYLKKANQEEYDALKQSWDDQIEGTRQKKKKEELKKQRDAELKALKEANNAAYDEEKKAWEERIKLVQENSSKSDLTAQRDAELKALKKQNEIALKEAKSYNKQRLADAEEANMQSVKTEESLQKAAELTDIAVRDMSDNANKMGTDMASLQNAYQGFAKQNYTMLDNLKLGYGGTKTEMERLLSDAERLTGQKYSVNSFADIVEAIHAIQIEAKISGLSWKEASDQVKKGLLTEDEAFEKMGTTAKEGSTTIEGSMKQMKAAWENFKIELGSDSGDIDIYIDFLVKSIETAGKNIIPRLEIIIGNIGKTIEKLSPILKEKFPILMKKLVPKIVKAATQLVGTLGLAIIDLLPELGQTIFDNLPLIWEKLTDLGSKLMDNVIKPAWDWVTQELPSYINEGLNRIDFFAIGKTMSDAIKSGLIGIADFVSEIDWKKVGTDIAEFINGIDFKAIVKAFLNGIVAIIKATPDLVSGFLGSLDFENFASAISLLLVPKLLASIASQLAVSEGWKSIQNVVNEKVSGTDGAGGIGSSMGFKLMAAFEAFLVGWKIGSWVYDHLEEEINGVLFPIFDKIKEAWDSLFSDEEDSLLSYAKRAISMPKEAAKSLGDKVRGWFNVSPSKFHATGGVLINQPIMTNHGDVFGEDGREVILPLDRNTGWMNELAQKLNRSGGVVVENLTISMDGMKIASDYDTDRFIERISERLEELRISQSRSLGGIG